MPTVSDKTTEALVPPQQNRRAVDAQGSPRDRVRQSLRGVGYEEGARALSPRGEGEPTEAPTSSAEAQRREAQRQSYEALLGRLLGGKLFEIVVNHTTPDALQKYAENAVDALIKAAGDLVGSVEALDAESRNAAGALVEVLGQILREQAQAYLASEEGQELANKVSNYVAEHPGEVIAAVLLAAAGAVAVNVPLPEIAAKTTLAKGIEAEVQAKLGRVRDLALESISARVQFEAGRFRAEARADHKEGQGTTGTVAASYGDETAMVSTTATLDKDGLLSARIGARGRAGQTSGAAGLSWQRDAGANADASVEVQDGNERYSGSARYEFDKGLLNIRLSREVTQGFFSRTNALMIEGGNVSTEQTARYEKDGQSIGVTRQTGPTGEQAALTARFSRRDLTVALNAAFGPSGSTASASVEGHPKEGMLYRADATYSLSDARLLNYGVSFGFQNPKEFEGFLLEYRRNNAPEIPEDRFRATVEFTIQQMMFRLQDETVLRGGRLSSGTASAHAAYPIGQNLALVGGATYGYGPDRTVGVMPQVGVQIRDIPVLVGYDTNSKAWSLRLTIPFGRR